MIHTLKAYGNYYIRHNFFLKKKINQIEENYSNPNNLYLKNDKFINLIHNVFEKNNFYKNLYFQHGLTKSDIKTIEDIDKLPIINKETIIKNSHKIKQGKPLFKIKGFTSGTTGTPLEVYRDYESVLTENAYVWWYRIKSGLNLRDKKISIRGDLNRKSLYSFDSASNTLFISSYALNNTNLEKIVKLIREFKPKAAFGYPSSLNTIANWLQENNQELNIPLSFTSSETLLIFQEEKINSAFNTKVFDWYGNAERTISLYREEGNYYEPFLYSVNEYNKNNIITTSLINNYFPLIRYEVNDKIDVSNQFNDVKKSVVINKIEGRIEDYIFLSDGTKIGRLDVVFKGVKNIKYAQIIQEQIDILIVNLVKGKNFSNEDENQLVKNFHRKVGKNCKILIKSIKKGDIVTSGSGKFKLVISKIKF